MDSNKTTLERAFELAQSGRCADLKDLLRRLKAEGYSRTQIEGRSLKHQLKTLTRDSYTKRIDDRNAQTGTADKNKSRTQIRLVV